MPGQPSCPAPSLPHVLADTITHLLSTLNKSLARTRPHLAVCHQGWCLDILTIQLHILLHSKELGESPCGRVVGCKHAFTRILNIRLESSQVLPVPRCVAAQKSCGTRLTRGAAVLHPWNIPYVQHSCGTGQRKQAAYRGSKYEAGSSPALVVTRGQQGACCAPIP